MSKKNIYYAALIGTGRIGYSLGLDKKREQPASHSMALNANRRINLVAGCDINAENLEQWHRANKKAESFSSVENLLKSRNFDIITIAVNENAHLETALAAISAKPRLIILEKPVALNMKQGLQIKKAAEKNNVPILVNHERRFSKDYQKVFSLIETIGHLQSIHASLYSGLRVYSKKEEKTGAYSLIHDGTHLVDIVRFLLGDIVFEKPHVFGVYRSEDGAVRNASAQYHTSDNISVVFDFSGRSRFFGFEIILTGTEGRISIGNGLAKVEYSRPSKLYTNFYSLTEDKIRFGKKTGYFSNMIKNAVDFLDGNDSLGSTIETGLAALKMLEDIKKRL
ncbi:MAG: Gfo/Idh/MocA family oxidoreductase [Treponema sp.]|jgi:predicted dehydrogenase|nr:Gfo/Idh/MocA family oxidoreductase [Treponema sp.]